MRRCCCIMSTSSQLTPPSPTHTHTHLAAGGDAGASSAGTSEPRKVSEMLWSGSKFVDRKVPISVDTRARSDARAAEVAAEAAASPYCTVASCTLEAAVADPSACAAARPPLAQPRDPVGAE